MGRFLIIVFLTISICVNAGFSQVEPQQDFLRQLQFEAIESGKPIFGFWGDKNNKYSSWTNHSNRLVPIYTFGVTLENYVGNKSVYRSKERLAELYGYNPTETLNPNANYMDQTDVYHLQNQAIAAGKTNIILMVFDGMDWDTTRAAAIYKNKKVLYDKGKGKGLAFLDYDNCLTDFGAFVCSPHNNAAGYDVDGQVIPTMGERRGGYSIDYGGNSPWAKPKSLQYLIGKLKTLDHAVTDSASSATSMTTGYKTCNGAIAVDPQGKQLEPIARRLQREGYKVGVVCNVPFCHATPGAAYANKVRRNDYQDISRDMLGIRSISHKKKALPGMDVVIGCGWGEIRKNETKKQGRNYIPGNKYLADPDLEAIDVESGGQYVVAQRTQGKRGRVVLAESAKQAIANDKKLFGFFGVSGGHLPYQTADGCFDPTRGDKKAERYDVRDIAENPTLADMTRSALSVLETSKKGFWLMIEAGDVDWANHNNNIDDSIGAVFSGEAAFEAVTEWVEKNSSWDDTAVILTADHGHLFVLTDPDALTGRKIQLEEVAAENSTTAN